MEGIFPFFFPSSKKPGGKQKNGMKLDFFIFSARLSIFGPYLQMSVSDPVLFKFDGKNKPDNFDSGNVGKIIIY